ncbi:D-alanine--D-alanine ligase [Aestuariivirga sp.]|uniref:D-alanine--D-alanine ligase n=1 Tax=Aestuariivirga sp. TaxID=2650926 RepID=UPI0025B7B10B|nr:D-alanine--D-alanine ligase [Aestuariivirga sp.]MCA3556403.1 D-alanine--D-alanine ligase [Aestuariivirga sp.]
MSRVPSHTTVAVLLGGWSAEREVSLSSGKACAAALQRAGFKVTPIDVRRETVVSELQRVRPDVAFNALHGKWGEDGCCAAILETLRIPYTHSGVLASSLAMHKEKSKAVFRAAGIPVAESMLAPLEEVAASHPMKPPYVVKPVAEGSSLGVHIVREGANAPVTAVLAERAIFGSHAMVERFVPGRELTCAVVGGTALGVIDIVSRGSGWYDYEAKYAPGGSQHILPARIPADVYNACRRYALAAHDALGCRGVSRADFRYDDKTGELIVLEVNTQPGMTGTSLVPELAVHAGLSYEELVTWMVGDASVDR